MSSKIETRLQMVERYPWSTVATFKETTELRKNVGVIGSAKVWELGIELAKKKGIVPDRSLLRLWEDQLNEPAIVITAKNARASIFDGAEKLALPTAWAKQVYEMNLVADTGRLLQNAYENLTTGDEAVSSDVALVQMFTAVTLSAYLRCARGLGFVRSYPVEPNGGLGRDGEQGVRSPKGRYWVETL